MGEAFLGVEYIKWLAKAVVRGMHTNFLGPIVKQAKELRVATFIHQLHWPG